MKKLLSLFLLLQTAVLTKAGDIIVSTPAEVLAAAKSAKAGDVIRVKGGEYKFDERINMAASGTPDQPVLFIADEKSSARPEFDFSNLSEDDSNQGIILRGNYWHIKGIDVFNAGDNGMLITGNNNTVEFCSFSECSDTGLQLVGGASNNLILNCDSYFNADSKIENADGFACKIDAGSGNIFRGCRAWQNLDDGWDGYLKKTDNITTVYENCWAFNNGQLKDGKPSGGDGNGFKSGGSDNKLLKHNAVYKNCIAAGNLKKGFDHNSNRGEVTLINCLAFDNQQGNMGFGSKNPLGKLTVKNSVVKGKAGSLYADVTIIEGNSWQSNQTGSNPSNFNVEELLKPRKADGCLPDISFAIK